MIRRVGNNILKALATAAKSKTVNASVFRSYAVLSSKGDQTIEHNTKTETNRLSKTLKKFWINVDTRFNEKTQSWDICLDDKPIKTPLGFPLAIPKCKKDLAYLVAHEWANLANLKVKTNSLPLTSLVARTIDLKETNKNDNPDLVAKVGNLDDIKMEFLRFFNTDTCLIFTTKDEYDGRLRQRQDELYLPLIKEYEDFFTKWGKEHDLLPEPSFKVKINYLDCETDGIRGNDQDSITQKVVLNWLDALPVDDIVAMEKTIMTAKSFLCGALLVRSNCGDPKLMKELYQFNKDGPETYFHKTIPEIIELGNLETIYQTEEWGEVEDTHDVDKVDWIRNLTAAALLVH